MTQASDGDDWTAPFREASVVDVNAGTGNAGIVTEMKINADRLWSLLEEVNRFGATEAGGAERLAWTPAEKAARQWLSRRCEDEGFDVDFDETGNVWAFAGRRPAVMLGSHLDTVPNGGRFDGALGIVSALETLLSARES